MIDLRIIHSEHRADALAPDNPMRDVPEVIRVYTNLDGSLSIKQVASGYMTTEVAVKGIVSTGLLWHEDILRGCGYDGPKNEYPGFPWEAIVKARKGVQGVIRLLESFGVDITLITLCTDWEAWSGDPLWDCGNWSAAVQDWPGPTANFGNAIANVPGMFHWPTAKGSCWASHGTGTTPSMFKAGILTTKPYWPRKAKGAAIACIADPEYFRYMNTVSATTHLVVHRDYVASSKRADIRLHWPLWPGDDERAKVPGFRLEQDKIIARAIGRGG